MPTSQVSLGSPLSSISTATVVPRSLPPQPWSHRSEELGHRHSHSTGSLTMSPHTNRPGTADSAHITYSAESSSNYDSDVLADTFADGLYQEELMRQEQLALQQDHERRRLRQRLAEERHRESQRQRGQEDATAAAAHRRTATNDEVGKERHPVYLLNCRGCGAFLSDRGMRAVLLLKPQITLYSTDVIPDNCGPLYPPSQMSFSRCGSREPVVERTCECLTQTLGCYGCGAQVGYHIASPCRKCTASVSELRRGSNGHRTVLHCSEITVRERRYVPGEPGVMVARPPMPPANLLRLSSPLPSASSMSATTRIMTRQVQQRNATLRYHQLSQSHSLRLPSNQERLRAINNARHLILTRTPQSPTRTAMISNSDNLALDDAADKHQYAGNVDTTYTSPPKTSQGSSNGIEARRIERGGVVFWSDLVSGGERTQPFDPDVVLSMPVVGR